MICCNVKKLNTACSISISRCSLSYLFVECGVNFLSVWPSSGPKFNQDDSQTGLLFNFECMYACESVCTVSVCVSLCVFDMSGIRASGAEVKVHRSKR